MLEISTIESICRWRSTASLPVVFVPTMGALHKGHASLISQARQLAASKGSVVVSIFVNPIQFGKGEDFEKYPRPTETDDALCRSLGVDVLFRPTPAEIYPQGFSTTIVESVLSMKLCGASRPGHFSGVCTVVAKFLHLIQPQYALFGEKDFQQLAILRRMVSDLHFPVEMISCPTIRESDGLALSSRNQYLTPKERSEAPKLYRALCEAREKFRTGDTKAASLKDGVTQRAMRIPHARIDYVDLVDTATFQSIDIAREGSILALAVFLGKARLIDHITL